jgi:hypothetical protein
LDQPAVGVPLWVPSTPSTATEALLATRTPKVEFVEVRSVTAPSSTDS